MSNAVATSRGSVNPSALFVAYLQGATVPEIAEEFGVSESIVTRYSREHKWKALALKADTPALLDTQDDVALSVIKKNRDENLKQAVRLRTEVDNTLNEATAGGLLPLRPAVLKDVAQAVSTIHDLTYRAVGDKDKQRDAGQGRATEMPSIVINLPAAIARPRGEGAIPV
jgi:hypothetical protein